MAAPRILVLGATGFIGPAVLRRAIARGIQPIAASRSGGPQHHGVQAVSLDRNEAAAVSAYVRSARADAVIDLLAYTAQDSLALTGALDGRVGRYVMASSGDVYRQYDLLHRRETGVALPELDEQAPLRTRLYPYRADPPRPSEAPDAWMDDYDKIPIENALAQTRDLSWSILRLPMVYGPGDPNHRFAWAISPMSAGSGPVRIDAGWANWRTSLGFVEDVADALVLAAIHPEAHRRRFNVGPAEVKTNLEWAKAFSEALAWRGELQVVPREETPEPRRSRLDALDLTVPCVLATAALRQTLGYSEVTHFGDGLAATIEAERAPLT